MPRGKMLAEGLDEIVEDGLGDVLGKERCLQGGLVVARAHREDALLQRGDEARGERVFVRQVQVGAVFPGGATGLPVRAVEDFLQRPLGHGKLRAVAGNRRLELEIGVGQHAGGGLCAAEGIQQHAQQRFYLGRTHVRLLSEQVVEVVLHERQTGFLLQPALQRRFADGQQFGVEERCRRHRVSHQALSAAFSGSGPGIVHVHGVFHHRVEIELSHATQQLLEGGHGLEEHGGPFGEPALESAKGGDACQRGGEFGLPGLAGGEDAGGVPGVLFGDFTA